MAARGVFDDAIFPGSAFIAEVQSNSTSQASGAIAATSFSGATENYLSSSGATALTTPSAAQVYANLVSILSVSPAQGGPGVATPQNNIVGTTFRFRLLNSNAGTLTLSAGTGVTLTGTATVLTNSWRDFAVTLLTPTTLQMTSVGSGTI